MKMRQTRRSLAANSLAGKNNSKFFFDMRKLWNACHIDFTYGALSTLVFSTWAYKAMVPYLIKRGRLEKLRRITENKTRLTKLASDNNWTIENWTSNWRSSLPGGVLIELEDIDVNRVQIEQSRESLMVFMMRQVNRHLPSSQFLSVMPISRNLLAVLHQKYFSDQLIADYVKWYTNGNQTSVTEFMLRDETWSAKLEG